MESITLKIVDLADQKKYMMPILIIWLLVSGTTYLIGTFIELNFWIVFTLVFSPFVFLVIRSRKSEKKERITIDQDKIESQFLGAIKFVDISELKVNPGNFVRVKTKQGAEYRLEEFGKVINMRVNKVEFHKFQEVLENGIKNIDDQKI